MAQIKRASQADSITNATSQAVVQQQMAAVVDALKMMGAGNANFKPLSPDVEADLLNTKYAVYVNYDIGSDNLVLGNYNSDRQQLNQELECGYSPFRPFKTFARACAEVARRSILAGTSNDINNRAAIFVDIADGYIFNGTGSASVSPWTEGSVSEAQLQALNDLTNPGLILPRGVSVIGRVLRNSVVRPTFVPAGSSNAVTGRVPIFRTTGGSFFFNFTFKDNAAVTSTHHLIHTHEFCDQQDLVEYYNKVMTIFGLTGAEVVNPGETEIVAPTPETPSSDVDDTRGSSPYIFNCSIRSNYGISGLMIDGRDVTGFRSMEAANFSIISLQKDYANAYQKYQSGSWINVTSFQDYIDTNINDLRMKIGGTFDWQTATYQTDYRHFGFKLVGNAFVQEVSEFTIGTGIHHWIASGSDADLTGCNAFAGQTALFSHGFSGLGTAGGAFPQDRGFLGIALKRPLRIAQDGSNLRRTTLGQVASIDGYVVSGGTAYIKLAAPISERTFSQLGISLKEDHYIWIVNSNRDFGPGVIPDQPENSTAVDVRAQLAAIPWNEQYPDRIYVKPNSNNNFLLNGMTVSELALNNVYVRRLVDTRAASEREYSLIVSNTSIATTRKPESGFILRLANRSTVADQIDPTNGTDQIFVVDSSGITTVDSPVADTAYYSIVLRPGDSAGSFSQSKYYLPGAPIFRNNRVYKASTKVGPGAFNSSQWVESSRGSIDARGISHPRSGVAPKLTIDKDLSNDPNSTTLGINLDTDADVVGQIQATTDYIAADRFLATLGYGTASTILLPQPEAARLFDPSASSSPIPTGKLTARAAWPLEFNKPSIIEAGQTIFRHIGRATYAKALPRYQRNPLTDQNKIDACTTPIAGGAIYADGSIENGLRLQGNTLIDLAAGRDISVEAAGIGGLTDSNGELVTETPTVESRPYTFENTVTFEGSAEFAQPIDIPGFTSGSVPGLKAAQSKYGLTRLATDQEVLAGLSGSAPGVGPAAIQPQNLKAVLDRINLMPDTETILYVDGSITRSSGLANYNTIPSAIWNDFRAYRATHGFSADWGATPPPSNTEQASLARKLCFSNVKEAFDFIANRNPVSRSNIIIFLYGSSSSNEGNATTVVTQCNYSGVTQIYISKGPSASAAAGETWSQQHCTGIFFIPYAELVLYNVNMNAAGRLASLNHENCTYFAAIICKSLTISNTRIQAYMTVESGFGFIADVYETIDLRAESDYIRYNNKINIDMKVRQIAGSLVAPFFPSVVMRAQGDFRLTARHFLATGETAKPLTININADIQNLASVNGGSRVLQVFPVGKDCYVINSTFGGSNYATCAFNFNFSGSNLTEVQLFTSADAAAESIWITGSGTNAASTATFTISNIGAVARFYGLVTPTPVKVLAATRTSNVNNTTNFLYSAAQTFRSAGVLAGNSYAWDIPAGSFRDGLFSYLASDQVTVP